MANRWNGIRVFPLLAIVLLPGCFEDIQQGSGDAGGGAQYMDLDLRFQFGGPSRGLQYKRHSGFCKRPGG